jgi:hypothetical protein
MDSHLLSPPGADPVRFTAAIRRFDEENSADPNTICYDGRLIPYELFYAQRVTGWVLRLCPEASEPLLLASRCQHLCRWVIPRRSYPMDRAGYLKWRADLKTFHARKSGAILAELGYEKETIARVQSLNLKKNPGHDRDLQVLEDALCLVTLEHQLTDLIRKNPPEKVVSILRKTWRKMSPAGREAALALPYTGEARALITEAIAGEEA